MSLPTLTPTVSGSKIDAVLAHMDDCHTIDATDPHEGSAIVRAALSIVSAARTITSER